MSSSFIQIKPIGTHAMGIIPWHNPQICSSSPDFPQARRRVSCNLFGRPERGAINETYRQEEKQRFELFQQRYTFDLEESLGSQQPKTKPITRPTYISTTTNRAESRLQGSESLIEKELREHEMKLKQQRKKTVNCNEKLVLAATAGDRINSRNLKSEEPNVTAIAAAAAVARTFVDSSKCASGHGERSKPYARQQSSMTDYYTQRKTVVCNNSRTSSAVQSVEEEVPEVLPILSNDSHGVESLTAKTTTSSSTISNFELFTSSSSASSATHSQQSKNESSQAQISLHTMATDVSTELA